MQAHILASLDIFNLSLKPNADPGDPGSEGAAPKSGLLCGKIQAE